MMIILSFLNSNRITKNDIIAKMLTKLKKLNCLVKPLIIRLQAQLTKTLNN